MSIDISTAKRQRADVAEIIQLQPGKKQPKPNQIFGSAARNGNVYRWGLAAAGGGPVSPMHQVLSRSVCAGKCAGEDQQLDWDSLAQIACDRYEEQNFASHGRIDVFTSIDAILWAGTVNALRRTTKRKPQPSIPDETATALIGSLLRLHEDAVGKALAASSPLSLLLGGELGLTLAWQFPNLENRARLIRTSTESIFDWCDFVPDSVSAGIEQATHARMVIASLVRCGDLLRNVFDSKLPKSGIELGQEMSHWIAAMTVKGGGSAFSNATSTDVKDDTAKDGLLERIAAFDVDSLTPAIAAAIGKTKTSGKLTWQVNLPESFITCDRSKLAIMLPEWDVRRGRMHIDYSNDDVSFELFAGKAKLIGGNIETSISVDQQDQQTQQDQQAQHAQGPWEEICRYTDDDVHYLEIEQHWTGGLVLQRQFLIVRDDRCVLVADAVIKDTATGPQTIDYQSVFPLSSDVDAIPDSEIREVALVRKKAESPSGAQKRQPSPKALAIPLSASEWRVQRSRAQLEVEASPLEEKSSLVLQAKGKEKLYVPLWIDCQRSRLQRLRTWRVLTVGDALRLCGSDEAAAFRIQAGEEHWAIYRSLAKARCRSFLGKHMIANFFVSRFDPSDGSHEDLITVDNDEVR